MTPATRECLGLLLVVALGTLGPIGCVSGDLPLRPILTDDGGDGGMCSPSDLQQDNANCGACGYACVNGRTCSAGRCTPAWLPVTSVGAPPDRYRHTAATISGRVLISGGTAVSNVGAFGDSYFYDPSTDVWAQGPALNQARCAHNSVSGGGKAYVFGGLTDCSDGYATGPGTEVYDPSVGSWQILDATNPPTPRYDGSAVWTPTNELLIFGGGGSGFGRTASGALLNGTSWDDASCNLTECCTGFATLLALDSDTIVAWGGDQLNPLGCSGPFLPAKLTLSSGTWTRWTPPAGSPTGPVQYADDGERWYALDDDASGCPSQTTVQMFNKMTGTWMSDQSPAPSGIDVGDATNHTVWTGAELFTWSAACAQPGVGGRYQPPAP